MASLDILKYPARFQFGQAGVPFSLAKVACTDTCVQMVINYYKDKLVSLNEVRKDSGKPPYGTGLTVSAALQALSRNGVTHYKWTLGYSRAFMKSKLALGPVIVSVNYRYYPSWPGSRCGGNDAREGGKTDCNFTGAHAVLVIKMLPVYHSNGTFARYDFLVRDPDHNSAGRPEKPRYDRITEAQLKTAMENVKYYPGWEKPSVMYPTRKKTL